MVLFFSATGNTEFIARQLALKLGDDCLNLLDRVKKNDHTVIHSEKPFIICAPVYVCEMPRFLAKYLKEQNIALSRQVWVHVTVYEEVGHGGSASVPHGITEIISVDMGCVGNGLSCTERTVSICAKDSHGPYNYEVVGKLIEAAKAEGADYAVDIYPMYGSDVEATLSAGYDIRHGLIGPGVYASHGYERSHIDGVWNTLKVLKGYLKV